MTDDNDSPRFTASRTVTPAFTLNSIGTYALEKAAANPEGSQLEIVTAVLMCALSMEAVLNAVGAHLFLDCSEEPCIWKAIERLSPRLKLEAIAERSGLQLDLGSLPFQDFTPMFKYRDDLVHAKTMRLSSTDVVFEMIHTGFSGVTELLAPWEQQSTVEIAARWRNSLHDMADTLCARSGCDNPLRSGNPWSAGM